MHRILITALLGLLSASVLAATPARVSQEPGQPVVIYDAGGVPLPQDDVVPDTRKRPLPIPQHLAPGNFKVFPVQTQLAVPGMLGPNRPSLRNGPGVPICIVGDDDLSRQWLHINTAWLKTHRVACLVARVETEQAFKALQLDAPGIRLVPASIDQLARATGLRVWPVLIGPDGRVSQ